MAKKNVRDEPLKPQVSENEQMSDIVRSEERRVGKECGS